MTDEAEQQSGFPRRLSKGRAFVYVIPCRGDTRFKVGFARDPIERWRSLHARFFAYFDLEQGLLLEAPRVAEARAVEQAAGGTSEWLRGVLDDVASRAVVLAKARGLVAHRPASTWLRAHLLERRDLLFDWSARMLEQVEYEREHAADPSHPALVAGVLRDTLDAYATVGIDLADHLPAAVLRWQMERARADPS